VTVMFDRYFGLPQHVVRSRLWAEMKPSEWSLYVCLMYESERYSNREIRRTDAQLRELSSLSSRTLCNARKKLQERGLVACQRASGNVYLYVICNPETGIPWPGPSKQKILYRRKQDHAAPLSTDTHVCSPAASAPWTSPVSLPKQEPERSPESHGVPLKFSK
jgi:hypothetical protein